MLINPCDCRLEIKKAVFFVFLFSTICTQCLLCWEFDITPKLYDEIEDIYHPQVEDYRLIQNYITFGDRPKVDRLYDRKYNKENYVNIAKTFKIIGDSEAEFPKSGLFSVNCDESQRENIIVLYTSFNKKYPEGLERLIKTISNSDYVGHVLYYFGGWPNAEGGDLVLAHVPYSFKACLFKEAQRLGFKRALWLDSATIPIVSLNTIFDMIKEKGYLAIGNTHTIGPVFNRTAAQAMNIPFRDTFEVQSCCSAQFGIDLTNPIGKKIADLWHFAARDKDAFYSPIHDQNALSIILYKLNIKDFLSYERVVDTYFRREIQPDSLFVLDKTFVHGRTPPFVFPN